MTINFTLAEKYLMRYLYPQESSLQSMLLVQDIAKKLEISDEDQSLLEGLKLAANTQTGEIVDWDHEYADEHTYDIEISNSELEFLKGRVSELDTQNKIKISFLDLAVKIKNTDAAKKTDSSPEVEA